ncbi:hypothetical protein [uncultured Eubacterium sp.]|uniref:hypothetical protein n=1 Tax=Eubacterium sp. TaxID=142586 RepID=UPI003265DFD6
MLNYSINLDELQTQLNNVDEHDPNFNKRELAFKNFVEDENVDVDNYEIEDLVYYLEHMDELFDGCYARDLNKRKMISSFSKIKPFMQGGLRFWF